MSDIKQKIRVGRDPCGGKDKCLGCMEQNAVLLSELRQPIDSLEFSHFHQLSLFCSPYNVGFAKVFKPVRHQTRISFVLFFFFFADMLKLIQISNTYPATVALERHWLNPGRPTWPSMLRSAPLLFFAKSNWESSKWSEASFLYFTVYFLQYFLCTWISSAGQRQAEALQWSISQLWALLISQALFKPSVQSVNMDLIYTTSKNELSLHTSPFAVGLKISAADSACC